MLARVVATLVVSFLFGAACRLFTPDVDPKGYPCGDPRMRSCGGGTCCWSWEACEIDPPRCAYVGPDYAHRDADAGVDSSAALR